LHKKFPIFAICKTKAAGTKDRSPPDQENLIEQELSEFSRQKIFKFNTALYQKKIKHFLKNNAQKISVLFLFVFFFSIRRNLNCQKLFLGYFDK
jgi:hypothetical protein